MNIPNELMSEANVQAEFYGVCKALGLNCTLELSTPVGRLDAAIFCSEWKNLIAIVECKHPKKGKMREGKQIRRYKTIGVPVYGLSRMDSLSLAMTIKNSCFHGVPWESVKAMEGKEWRSRRVRIDGVLKGKFNSADLDEDVNFKSN